MSKLTSLLNKSVGLLSRSVMRTGSIILRRRAKLEALSAAIEWFVKRNNHRPLQLTHESNYGDVHLMSDGDRIQLTWWIGDKALPTDIEHSDNDASQPPNTTPVAVNKQPVYQTTQRATAVHACEPKPQYQPQPQPIPTSDAKQLSTTSDMSNVPNAPNSDSIGEVVGDAVGDAVGEFVGDVVETVIDEVVGQVFDGGSPRNKQSVTREPTAASDTPEYHNPR